MEKDEIVALKKVGEQEKLRQKISSLMWDIRSAAERATCDNYKDWYKEIYTLKCRLEDAEQLYLELD